jgi:hypothetical protein
MIDNYVQTVFWLFLSWSFSHYPNLDLFIWQRLLAAILISIFFLQAAYTRFLNPH